MVAVVAGGGSGVVLGGQGPQIPVSAPCLSQSPKVEAGKAVGPVGGGAGVVVVGGTAVVGLVAAAGAACTTADRMEAAVAGSAAISAL